MTGRGVLAVGLILAVTACADDGPTGSFTEGAGIEPSGAGELTSTPVIEGLVGPTQLARDGRGGYVLAELNGSEGEGAGRVLHFASFDDEPEVLVTDLLTPTGVAVDGDLLWIMERRTLSVGPLDDPDDRTIVLDEMPFNGRSQGTISAVEGGGILYDTSGARDGSELVAGSGTLWFLAGPDSEPEPLATGFKHAYAHTPVGDGRWFVTEISDGILNGGAPPDELVLAEVGDDFGYPRCIGDNEPVTAFGATEADCASAPRSHAVLPARSTPTGVAIAPWDPGTVLVALWSTGEIVAVPADPSGAPHEAVVVFDAIRHPQHLLADGEGLLVVDHTGGRVLSIAP